MTQSSDPLIQAVFDAVEAYCAARRDHAFSAAEPRVRLHEPTFGAEEINAFVEKLLTTRVTMGPTVVAFENAYAAFGAYGAAITVNSGSSANLLAIAALVNPACRDGLKPGDEVIVSALSWSTTIWPLMQMGLVPVVVDIDPETLNIDPEKAEAAIGPRTRAIMPVHVYGNPCDMDALCDICARRGLTLIEDTCESMGATYGGRAVGSFGRVGTFSLYFSHHITTLEGGFCVTGDPEFAELMRILRAHGWVRDAKRRDALAAGHPGIDPKFLFVNVGFNLRMSEPQAAMGLEQLRKLPGFVAARRQGAARMHALLAPFADLIAPQRATPKSDPSWFGIPLTVADGAKFSAAELRAHLESRGIETRAVIAGNIAAQPAMRLFPHVVPAPMPNADRVMRQGFSIANHQDVGEEAQDHMARAFADFFAARA